MSIGILGGGVWGSALARVLSKNKVVIYARDKNIVKSINEHKLNPKLNYSSFNDNVSATDQIKNLQNVKFLFIALPAQKIREVTENSELNNIGKEIEGKVWMDIATDTDHKEFGLWSFWNMQMWHSAMV